MTFQPAEPPTMMVGLSGPNTIAGRIYERMREMILRAEIMPGEKLLPAQLAQTFGVSATPIREALRLLEQANLVEIMPHRGAIVRPTLTAKQVDDLYTVRLVMEQLAMRSASFSSSRREWGELEEAVENYGRAIAKDDFENALLWDLRFHRLLIQASGNQVLEEIFARLENQIQILRRLDRGMTRRQSSVKDHRLIVKALKRGDYDAAQAALERHILNGREHVLNVLGKLPGS